MAQGLQGRICFRYHNIIKKTTPSPTPTLKKIKKFIVLFVTIFFKRKLPYVILRSGKFGNLVISFFKAYFKNHGFLNTLKNYLISEGWSLYRPVSGA